MTTLDDRPVTGVDSLAALQGELRAAALREQDAYNFGHHDGWQEGYRAAHAEMVEWWATLAHSVRHDADRLRGTVPEPVDRATCHCDGTTWRDWFTTEELAVLDGEA